MHNSQTIDANSRQRYVTHQKPLEKIWRIVVEWRHMVWGILVTTGLGNVLLHYAMKPLHGPMFMNLILWCATDS